MNDTHTHPKTRNRPRWLKSLIVIAIVIVGVYLLRLALGIGTAAIHYSKTPDFAEYIASHPVDSATIDKLLPSGELIHTSDSWSTGPVDPLSLSPGEGDLVLADIALMIDISRDNEDLLSFKEVFSVALNRKDWTHHGVHIQKHQVMTAPGLRAVVVTSISDPEEMIGEDSMGKGGAFINVYLLSGVGPSQTRFQHYPDGGGWSGGPKMGPLQPSFPLWRLLTGITHNMKPLPEEGLIHHVRQRVRFDWIKYEDGGYGGPSMSYPHHTVNTDEYSYDLKIRIEDSKNGGEPGRFETTKSLRKTWNDEIW